MIWEESGESVGGGGDGVHTTCHGRCSVCFLESSCPFSTS